MNVFLPIAVRISGFVLVVLALARLPSQYFAYTVRPEYGVLSFTLPSIIPIFVGVFLIFLPNTVGRKIESSIPPVITIESPKNVLFIGCIMVGVVLAFYTISDLVFHLSTMFFIYNTPAVELSILTFDYPSLIATVVELLLAFILIAKSRTLVTIMLPANETSNKSLQPTANASAE